VRWFGGRADEEAATVLLGLPLAFVAPDVTGFFLGCCRQCHGCTSVSLRPVFGKTKHIYVNLSLFRRHAQQHLKEGRSTPPRGPGQPWVSPSTRGLTAAGAPGASAGAAACSWQKQAHLRKSVTFSSPSTATRQRGAQHAAPRSRAALGIPLHTRTHRGGGAGGVSGRCGLFLAKPSTFT